jgi:hypothetical protein
MKQFALLLVMICNSVKNDSQTIAYIKFKYEGASDTFRWPTFISAQKLDDQLINYEYASIYQVPDSSLQKIAAELIGNFRESKPTITNYEVTIVRRNGIVLKLNAPAEIMKSKIRRMIARTLGRTRFGDSISQAISYKIEPNFERYLDTIIHR